MKSYAVVILLICIVSSLTTAQPNELKPHDTNAHLMYISAQDDIGQVAMRIDKDVIQLRTVKARLENILQQLAEKSLTELHFYCHDPGLDRAKKTIRLKRDSLPDMLQSLFSTPYTFTLMNREVAVTKGALSVTAIHAYPSSCEKTGQPVRSFRLWRRDPVLNQSVHEMGLAGLAHILATGSPNARRRALEILRLKQQAEAFELAERALADDYPDVILAAARVLEQLDHQHDRQRAAEAIAQRLREKPYFELVMALAGLSPSMAWPKIEALMASQDQRAQGVAVRAISLTQDQRGIEGLSMIAQGQVFPLVKQAILALGHIGGPPAFTSLTRLLSMGDASRQAIAAQAMSFLSPPLRSEANQILEAHLKAEATPDEVFDSLVAISYLEPLHSLLSDVTVAPRVHIRALQALGRKGMDKATDTIVLGLKRPNPKVRIEAVLALSKIAPDNAIEPLIRATRDPDPHVKTAAANGLSRFMAIPVIVTGLSKAIDDPHGSVRKAAVDALSKLTPPGNERVISELRRAAKHADPEVAQYATAWLRSRGWQ